jgi:allophanate hydrolase
MRSNESFLMDDLLDAYRSNRLSPKEVIECALERANDAPQRHVWITRLVREQILDYVRAIEGRSIDELPLYGIPFVIKDNIDLSGVPTTAGCPSFAYVPTRSSTVVQKLLDAGAIPLGKTNLDQFATGLVGTRSPYGACRNSFNSVYISGGSSGGSAVAVATGLASFALGTDTAGSGRVPAAFNNIVGLKPSLGRISTRGIVPACRSLDCASIFSLTTADAARVLSVIEGFDVEDPYSRMARNVAIQDRRFGVPRGSQLQFFGDHEYARLFEQAVARINMVGGRVVEIDFAPFLDAARLLYGGPFLAERFAAVGDFIDGHAPEVHPVTRQIILAGKTISAADAFKAQYHLESLKRTSASVWSAVDVMLVPTAGTVYEISQIDAEPLLLNTNLGYYTNFLNLLDLAGVAIPAGFRGDGLPFGVTLIARSGTDRALLALAGELHRNCVDKLGALDLRNPPPSKYSYATDTLAIHESRMVLAVCGAHMEGLPLNWQLRDRGGHLVRSAQTAPSYRLFALPGGPTPRPGLVRATSGGTSIAVEIWTMRSEDFGSLVENIPPPLGIGKIELLDGETVPGFLCESYAIENAVDITHHGGWRAYLRAPA